MPFPFGKGSKAALEGASREQGEHQGRRGEHRGSRGSREGAGGSTEGAEGSVIGQCRGAAMGA